MVSPRSGRRPEDTPPLGGVTLRGGMRALILLLILATLAAILTSLGFGLFHLSRGRPEDSRKLARALTIRIALSLVLFALLMLAWYLGLISPHPLEGGGAGPHP
jgi:Protein of unknown function (DUF2909)